MEYIGQSCTSLNLRINNHRHHIKKYAINGKLSLPKNNTYSTYEFEHFKTHDFKDTTFRILEIVADEKARLQRETFHILSRKTIFPYGLNTFLSKKTPVLNDVHNSVFSVFYLNGNKTTRGNRGPGFNGKFHKFDENTILTNILSNFDKPNFVKTTKNLIYGLKDKAVNRLAQASIYFKFNNNFVKKLIVDLCKHKLKINKIVNANDDIRRRSYFRLNFTNNILDKVNLAAVLRSNDCRFPINNVKPILSFKYNKTLGNIAKNHRQTITLDVQPSNCNCDVFRNTTYFDNNHDHIVTGDLSFVDNIELERLLNMGTKFRLQKFKDRNKILKQLDEDIDSYAVYCSEAFGYPLTTFNAWKHCMKDGIHNNLKKFFQIKNNNIAHDNMKAAFLKLKELQKSFVFTSIDKAENNFAIICKFYYLQLIDFELKNSITYKKDDSEVDHLYKIMADWHKILNVKQKSTTTTSIPFLYLIPKFHKNPVKFRFIACGVKSPLKTIGLVFQDLLTRVIKKINFATSYEDTNQNWIIYDNKKVLDILNNVDFITSVDTFDFENLYTSLPLEDIKETLIQLHATFELEDIVSIIKWTNLLECNLFYNYILFNKTIYRQSNGIPMGANYSTAVCNLFLFYKEYIFMKKADTATIDAFRYTFRYIDDLITFNNTIGFNSSHKIYPDALKLVKTNSSNLATNFLDITIEIKGDYINFYKYDKRGDFNFKSIQYINWNSCISKRVIGNTFTSQIYRMLKINKQKDNFDNEVRILIEKFLGNDVPSGLIKYLLQLFNNKVITDLHRFI